MRRSILLVLAAAFVLGIAAPAQAKPTKTVYDSVNANAFWTSVEQVSATQTVRTTWYVGVYKSTDGTFSDLYVETATCTSAATPKEEDCTYEYMSGYTDLSTGVFTIDEADLTTAHLEETYLLQSWDENGNPVDEMTASIVTDWTGEGETHRNSGKSSYCDSFTCYKSRFEEASRSAEAVGTINGDDLGETYDAWLSTWHSESMEWQKK